MTNGEIRFLNENLIIYKENEELITMYDEYINNIVELFDFIMKKNSNLFYSIVFDILLQQGFFSANRKHEKKENFKELLLKPGMSVVNGIGHCRNIACFYEDIFKHIYNYPLKMCVIDSNGLMDDDTKNTGNHVINLTQYYGRIYGIDLLNHCVFKIWENDTLKGIDIDYSLKHAPNGNLALDLITLLDKNTSILKSVIMNIALFHDPNYGNALTKEKISKIFIRSLDFIDKKDKILQSFNNDNKELTNEIKKKMLLLK